MIGHYSLGGVEAYQELQKHVASEEDAARLVQLATSFGEVRVTYKGGVLAVNIREGYYNIEITEPRKVDTITDRMIRESRKKK